MAHDEKMSMAAHISPLSASAVLGNMGELLPDIEALKDVHAHELSMQETRTAGIAAGTLAKTGSDVTTAVTGSA